MDIDTIPLDRIAYGIVPPKSKQVIPSEGPPRSLKVGEKVIVEVTFRYEFVTGSGEITTCWALEIENERKAKMLGELSIDLPPRPGTEKK